jgi:hypothetical protein
MEKMYSDHQD